MENNETSNSNWKRDLVLVLVPILATTLLNHWSNSYFMDKERSFLAVDAIKTDEQAAAALDLKFKQQNDLLLSKLEFERSQMEKTISSEYEIEELNQASSEKSRLHQSCLSSARQLLAHRARRFDEIETAKGVFDNSYLLLTFLLVDLQGSPADQFKKQSNFLNAIQKLIFSSMRLDASITKATPFFGNESKASAISFRNQFVLFPTKWFEIITAHSKTDAGPNEAIKDISAEMKLIEASYGVYLIKMANEMANAEQKCVS